MSRASLWGFSKTSGQNPELLYGQNFISHLGVYRSSLVRALGGLRLGFEGGPRTTILPCGRQPRRKGPVVHLPHVLYHWRGSPGAGTFSSTRSGRAVDAARRAIKEQLAGLGVDAERRRRRLRLPPRTFARTPRHGRASALSGARQQHGATLYDTSLRVYSKNRLPRHGNYRGPRRARQSRRCRPRYCRRGRLAGSCEARTLLISSGRSTKRCAAHQARSSCFWMSDMLVIEPGWLKEMVLLAKQPGIGAVGAKFAQPTERPGSVACFLRNLIKSPAPVHENSAAAPGYSAIPLHAGRVMRQRCLHGSPWCPFQIRGRLQQKAISRGTSTMSISVSAFAVAVIASCGRRMRGSITEEAKNQRGAVMKNATSARGKSPPCTNAGVKISSVILSLKMPIFRSRQTTPSGQLPRASPMPWQETTARERSSSTRVAKAEIANTCWQPELPKLARRQALIVIAIVVSYGRG